MMSTLMAADGTNLLHRSFHALRETQMHNSKGEAVWAVHGIVGALAKYIDATGPTSMIVAFDLKGGCPSRKELAPEYKGGRAETPAELTEQLLASHIVLQEMGICCPSVQDWEADDVMATVATMASAAGAKCVVVSADKDAHQLLSDLVSIYKPEGVVLSHEGLVAKYGVDATRWVEYTALLGEGADNLPGVTGIGHKRAAALIENFGDIEQAIGDYGRSSLVIGMRLAQALVDQAETFRRNRAVGTLRRDLSLELANMKLKDVNPEQIREVAIKYEIPSAGTRLAGAVMRAQK
jgi:DNA polymerase-1